MPFYRISLSYPNDDWFFNRNLLKSVALPILLTNAAYVQASLTQIFFFFKKEREIQIYDTLVSVPGSE